jgi:hypothetical protein
LQKCWQSYLGGQADVKLSAIKVTWEKPANEEEEKKEADDPRDGVPAQAGLLFRRNADSKNDSNPRSHLKNKITIFIWNLFFLDHYVL